MKKLISLYYLYSLFTGGAAVTCPAPRELRPGDGNLPSGWKFWAGNLNAGFPFRGAYWGDTKEACKSPVYCHYGNPDFSDPALIISSVEIFSSDQIESHSGWVKAESTSYWCPSRTHDPETCAFGSEPSSETVEEAPQTFKFFNKPGDILENIHVDPCFQSFPGSYLVVSPEPKEGSYSISQRALAPETLKSYTLDKQISNRKFIGDFFCKHILHTSKEERTKRLKEKNFENSDYTVSFSDPQFIEIEISKRKKCLLK